jgi:plasmid stabilization system protein ParE
MKLEFDREAESELLAAADWYEAQRAGLGRRFGAAVERALLSVAERPDAHPRAEQSSRAAVRRLLVAEFPYAIVFMRIEDRVRILAVAHLHREPGYWSHRARRPKR